MKTPHAVQNVRFLGLVLAGAALTRAALISYDGATYAPGTALDGLTGGTSWASAWSGTNSIRAGSLAYTNNSALLVTEGNAFLIEGSTNLNTSAFRTLETNGFDTLTTNINDVTYFGSGGAIVWLSFLARDDDGSPADTYAGVQLYQDDLDVGLIGRRWNSKKWGGYLYGAFGSSSDIIASNAATALIVAQIQSRSSSQTNWDSWVKLYINPSLDAFDPNAFDWQFYGGGGNQLHFNRIALRGNAHMTIDELRLGTSYEDVLPITWPAPEDPYEPFAYPADVLDTANGGTSWLGPWWTWVPSNNLVAAPGMEYSTLVSTGNCLLTSGNDDASWRKTRAAYGTGTVWISFLTAYNGFMPATAGAGGLSLGINGTNDWERLFIGKRWGADTWGIAKKVGDTEEAGSSSTNAAGTNVTWLVTRVDFGAAPSIYLWVNRLPDTEPALDAADAVLLNQPEFYFDEVRVKSGPADGLLMDEIRIGNTYACVAPVVPEATMGMLVGCSVWYACRKQITHSHTRNQR